MLELQETNITNIHNINSMSGIYAILKEQVGNMHPQAMENALGSIAYLLSLNTPHINLIINYFLALPRQAHTYQPRYTSAPPLSILENMLKSSISNAWNNTFGLPYTPLSLRKDIPLQKDLDGAIFHLSNTTSTNEYASAQDAYRRRMDNVRRALAVARRCDGEYMDAQNLLVRLTPGNTHGDWRTFFAILESFRYTSDSDEMAAWIDEVQATVARICDPHTALEDAHAEIPVLYVKMAYMVAVYPVLETQMVYQGSPYLELKAYFDDVIVKKLKANCGGAQKQAGFMGINGPCLRRPTTDWEDVYRGISSRTAVMARGL
ncbi:hypothetical protein ABW21_db0209648 [Orbilia brochopaga]|nr:hypothetical protein ABW21_db0209648 [Drechslerella brochopaga]